MLTVKLALAQQSLAGAVFTFSDLLHDLTPDELLAAKPIAERLTDAQNRMSALVRRVKERVSSEQN